MSVDDTYCHTTKMKNLFCPMGANHGKVGYCLFNLGLKKMFKKEKNCSVFYHFNNPIKLVMSSTTSSRKNITS